jgi:hypothetical protein
MLLKCPKLAFF